TASINVYSPCLHDALPIWPDVGEAQHGWLGPRCEQYLYLGERLRPACRDAQRHELRGPHRLADAEREGAGEHHELPERRPDCLEIGRACVGKEGSLRVSAKE